MTQVISSQAVISTFSVPGPGICATVNDEKAEGECSYCNSLLAFTTPITT